LDKQKRFATYSHSNSRRGHTVVTGSRFQIASTDIHQLVLASFLAH